MKERLDKIIKKIDFRIKNIDLSLEYKKIERDLLKNILSSSGSFLIDSNKNIMVSNVILAAIILNEEYKDINEVLELFNKYKERIDNLSSLFLEDSFNAIVQMKKESLNIDDLMYNLNRNIEKINLNVEVNINKDQSLKKINIELVELFKIFILADLDLFCIASVIKDINEKKEELAEFIDVLQDESLNRKKFSKYIMDGYIKESYHKDEVNEQLSRIGKYFQEISKENRKIMKNKRILLGNLTELKEKLLKSKDEEEIKDISRICSIIPVGLKYDILKYISIFNAKYYLKLEEEYIDKKENSLINYIDLFNKLNIDFNSISETFQEKILGIKIDKLKYIIVFLEKINVTINSDIINVITKTNVKYLDNLNIYIEKGILTKKFIKENISVIYDENIYNKLLLNLNVLSESGINIKDIDEDSVKIYLKDSLLIKANIELCNNFQINIKTRYLKNYMFLSEEKLEQKIIGLKNLNIDINNNLEVLNSDINIIKRIKICNILGIDIYENDKIKLEILNKDEFFIPNSKIDDYIPSDGKQKKYV